MTNVEDTLTIEQLKLKISMAERLGFYDDVIHWQNELNKLLNKDGML